MRPFVLVLARAVLGAAVAVLFAFSGVPRASACGGLFCNGAQTPAVVQDEENIIFAYTGEETIAVIQVFYTGPADRFAWMLPVSGNPELSVSSDSAFAALRARTDPRYTMRTTIEGECRSSPGAGRPIGYPDAGFAASDSGGPPPEPPDVDVLSAGTVGPYDFAILSIDPDAPNATGQMSQWLAANGYDTSALGVGRLAPYLEAGQNVLAFRLTKSTDIGSIRPIRLSFGPGLPSIPLRPTAAAAATDMRIRVWVLGESRAVPANYASVELNDALIDWFSPADGYEEVVSRAVNEAGGQGFVLESAGASVGIADVIAPPRLRATLDQYAAEEWAEREALLIRLVVQGFGALDGMLDVVGDHVQAEGLEPAQVLACPACLAIREVAFREGSSPSMFLDALEAQVLVPLEETAALFDELPYVTRMLSTMDGAEMTLDPVFDFVPSLVTVEARREASRVVECHPNVFVQDAPWRATLPSGVVVRGAGTSWPFSAEATDIPASRVVRRIGPNGESQVVTDNSQAIDEAVGAADPPRPVVSPASGCRASAGEPYRAAGLLMLLAVGLLLRRRR